MVGGGGGRLLGEGGWGSVLVNHTFTQKDWNWGNIRVISVRRDPDLRPCRDPVRSRGLTVAISRDGSGGQNGPVHGALRLSGK